MSSMSWQLNAMKKLLCLSNTIGAFDMTSLHAALQPAAGG